MKKSLFALLMGLCLLSTASPAPAQEHVPAQERGSVSAEESTLPPAITPSTATPAAGATPSIAAPTPPPIADAPSPTEGRELWSGALYTSTYKAGVCIDPAGKVRGVLLLRTMGGKTDVYHFYGSLENGIVRATHGSGHSFAGSFPAADAVQGTITLKNGRSINLTGKRQQHVVLTENCRPLSQ